MSGDAGAAADDLNQQGRDLADAGDHEAAVEVLRRAANLGSLDAAFNLGNSLSALGRFDEAVHAHRAAAEGGDDDAWLNLAIALLELERWPEAGAAARRAVEAGDVQAWGPLGTALLEQGDRLEALSAFARAAELGAQGAAQGAHLLREDGAEGEAWAWAARAATAGDRESAAVLATWRWMATADPALEDDLRRAAEDLPDARSSLADLLRRAGRVAEAREVLERGAGLGERASWLPLGNLYLDEMDDDVAAEAAYRAGIDSGDLFCHHNLALLLLDRGDEAAAVEQLQIGADGGDELAARTLRELTGDT